MKYRLVIFDLEGTLVHGLGAEYTAFLREVIKVEGRPPQLGDVEAALDSGDPIAALPCIKEGPDCLKTWDVFLQNRLEGHGFDFDLYPGAITLLEKLQAADVDMVLLTSFSRRTVRSIVERFELDRFFQEIYTADDGPSKPNPLLMQKAIDFALVESEKTLMVGDSVADMLVAQNAGCAAAGLTWGRSSVAQLSAVEGVIGCYSSLGSFTESLSL